MKIENDKFYTIGFLRKVLREKGLPSSMYSILAYEKKNLIESPRMKVNNWRLYRGREIKVLVEKIAGRI